MCMCYTVPRKSLVLITSSKLNTYPVEVLAAIVNCDSLLSFKCLSFICCCRSISGGSYADTVIIIYIAPVVFGTFKFKGMTMVTPPVYRGIMSMSRHVFLFESSPFSDVCSFRIFVPVRPRLWVIVATCDGGGCTVDCSIKCYIFPSSVCSVAFSN